MHSTWGCPGKWKHGPKPAVRCRADSFPQKEKTRVWVSLITTCAQLESLVEARALASGDPKHGVFLWVPGEEGLKQVLCNQRLATLKLF